MCCLAQLSRFVYLLNQQGFQPQYREIGKCVQHDTLRSQDGMQLKCVRFCDRMIWVFPNLNSFEMLASFFLRLFFSVHFFKARDKNIPVLKLTLQIHS